MSGIPTVTALPCWSAKRLSKRSLDETKWNPGQFSTRAVPVFLDFAALYPGYTRFTLGVSIVSFIQMQQWIFLLVAIVSEVIATSALKASDGFSRVWPSLIVVTGYGAAFYFLSLTLKIIPVGVAYAIWSGVGVALIALIAWAFFGQALDIPAIVGLLLIVAGVVVLNLFSKTVSHS